MRSKLGTLQTVITSDRVQIETDQTLWFSYGKSAKVETGPKGHRAALAQPRRKTVGMSDLISIILSMVNLWLIIGRTLYLVGGLEHGFYDFPCFRDNIIPTDEPHDFSEAGWVPCRKGRPFRRFQCHCDGDVHEFSWGLGDPRRPSLMWTFVNVRPE